jgi:preprotein translocase subunit SecA
MTIEFRFAEQAPEPSIPAPAAPLPGGFTEVHIDPLTGENERAALSLAGPTLAGDVGALALAQRAAVPPSALAEGWERTGRNAPCPCGSGKKFKHCHGLLV